jgi:peroxiredoxin
MKRYALLAASAALLAAPLAYAGGAAVGEVAPEIVLKDAAGKELKLSSRRGDVIVLDFWATWCKPCLAELAALDVLYREEKARGLIVIAINVDEDSAAARAFLEKSPVSFPVLFDPAGASKERYGAEELPALYLIDRAQKIFANYKGLAEEERLKKELAPLLKKKKVKGR